MKTTILLDQEPHPLQGHVVRALLKVEGDTPTGANRTPLNISVVLDRSGSMHGEKLHAAREAAALLVQRLAPEDVVSVVAFADQVDTVSLPQVGGGEQVSTAIRAIHAGGSTNLSGGWLKGRDHVAQNFEARKANRIVLMTDGQANVGIQDPDQLAGLCGTANEQGIRTTTIGFGADYDELLLRRMAEAGGGNLHYIEHADQAPAVFAEEIEGLLSLAAQNLTLTIAPTTVAQTVAVHHSYARQQLGDALQLELGDLYAREPKLVLIEFLVLAPTETPTEICTLTLKGTVLRADGAIEVQEIVIPVTTSLADGPVANPEVRRELLLLEAAKVRTEVLEDQRRGDYGAASDKLRTIADKLREAGIDDEQVREEAADLQLMADTAQATPILASADVKYMQQRAYDSGLGMRDKLAHISRSRRKDR
jgi:Ca-activated chloride channel family protein